MMQEFIKSLQAYSSVPLMRGEFGKIFERLYAHHVNGMVINNQWADVIKDNVGWQLKTDTDNPNREVVLKRLTVPNTQELLSEHLYQTLGNLLLTAFNQYAYFTMQSNNLTSLRYGKLSFTDETLTYTETEIMNDYNCLLFDPVLFTWKLSKTGKSLHGYLVHTKLKFFTWHYTGDNHFKFYQEQAWLNPSRPHYKCFYAKRPSMRSVEDFVRLNSN